MKKFILLSLTAAFILSCNKDAGPGGTSSIVGRVKVYDVNGIGDTLDSYYGMDEDVYLIYGEEAIGLDTYDDKFACSYDGSYRFDYLTPGTYRVFAYSQCDTCNDGVKPVFRTVQITDKKTEVTVSDISILK